MSVPVIAVFGSSRTRPGSAAWEQAFSWGEAIARGGFAVASGGYGGSMEALSKGAEAAGGLVIGVTAPDLFKSRSGANAHVDVEFPAPTLTGRIERMLEMSRAALALPGGLGTLAEILVAWNVAYIQRLQNLPVLPLAVDHRWLGMFRPHLEVSQREIDLLRAISSLDDLRDFLESLA